MPFVVHDLCFAIYTNDFQLFQNWLVLFYDIVPRVSDAIPSSLNNGRERLFSVSSFPCTRMAQQIVEQLFDRSRIF